MASPPEKRTYPDRPYVGVGVVVFKGEAVLLVERPGPDGENAWSLPGGAQELGETAQEAAHRELREEAGIAIELFGLIDVVDFIEPDEGGAVRRHYTLIDFAGEWRAGELTPGSDVTVACWAPLARLEDYTLWDETARVIAEAAELRARTLRL